MAIKQIISLRHLLSLAAVLMTVSLSAQTTMKEVADAYNEGVQYITSNQELAIKAFEKTIALADAVAEPEAVQLKNNAIGQIPKLYFDWARALAGKNDLKGAVTQLENCLKASEKYKSTQYVRNATTTLAAIHLSLGNNALTAKDYPTALTNYDAAISYDNQSVKSFLGKIMVYQAQNQLDEMVEIAEAAIAAGSRPNDAAVLVDINRVLSTAFFNAAQKSMQDKNYKMTEEHLNNSVKFGNDNSVVYYQLGLARMNMDKWSEAVDAFMEAADTEEGGDAEKAKIYFNMAKCYESLNNATKACESYKKALFGEFAAAAKYQIETVLKCG
jgi:tetratricopeptide (TPR) repeat protein